MLFVIQEPPSDPGTSDDPAAIRWAAGVRSFLSPTYDTFRSWSKESAWRSDWRDNHRARGIDPAHAIHMERFNASQAPRPRVHEVRRRVRQLLLTSRVTGARTPAAVRAGEAHGNSQPRTETAHGPVNARKGKEHQWKGGLIEALALEPQTMQCMHENGRPFDPSSKQERKRNTNTKRNKK